MRYWLISFTGWKNLLYQEDQQIFPQKIYRFVPVAAFIILCSFNSVFAQSEDTTQTERELPEQTKREQIPSSSQTPYNSDILQSDIDRYQLRDYGSSSRFYRHLKYRDAEDFLLSEEEGYNRYGAEWERKINEDLKAILEATFKEESELMKLLGRLAPFLRFGFFEPYEVPITRVEHPDKVDVIEE